MWPVYGGLSRLSVDKVVLDLCGRRSDQALLPLMTMNFCGVGLLVLVVVFFKFLLYEKCPVRDLNLHRINF